MVDPPEDELSENGNSENCNLDGDESPDETRSTKETTFKKSKN